MSILESVLIVAALFMNIFLIGQYEGSMVRHLNWTTIGVICLIVGVFETTAMWAGYLLTRISFFSNSESEDLKCFCYFVAAVLFLLIAVFALHHGRQIYHIIKKKKADGGRRQEHEEREDSDDYADFD